jgi:hypothetical protein
LQRRLLLAAASAAFLLIYVGVGCTKLDTTTLGSDLVTVDNINTFADTLGVNATQGYFNDSTILQKGENHAIGVITTDNLFGSTDARVYVQFKPTFYPFYFGNAGDTVKNSSFTLGSSFAGFDSAFICLSYRGAWGDTSSASNIAQTFEVRAIVDDGFRQKTDTIRQLGSATPAVDNTLIGTALINPASIAQKFFLGRGVNKDSITNQIRIKLTGAGATFAAALFNGQDTVSSSMNNGFLADSFFRKKYNGFEIRVKSNNPSGNTLYFVNLADVKSRLEFHYRKIKAGVKDTVVQSFQMYTSQVGNTAASSSMNYIKRNYSTASPALPAANAATNNVFIQTAPGTFANLSIPGLTGYTNRIVHRAYLIVEQTPDNAITDNIYKAPPFLYLDLKDTVPQRYKPLYFDLSSSVPYNPDANVVNPVYHPYPFGNVDVQTFGGFELKRFEPAGTAFSRYEINITRYVQHIVSNGYKNYDLRLYAPFNYYYPQYLGTQYIIPYFNPIALGRVRVGSGSNSNHRMKLVVVYSKI